MWKQFSSALPSNNTGSLGRLGSLLRKLRKDPKLLQQYYQIIRDQLKDGIFERVSDDKPSVLGVLSTTPTCISKSCKEYQSKNYI